jgi:hypothetical protein
MKLFIAAASTLVAINAQERKFSHITNMAWTQIQDKTTTVNQKTLNKMVQNYGCHCFPGLSKIAGGAGPAQDEYDALCRDLARCHKCIDSDYVNEIAADNTWDANIGKYRWDLMGDGSIDCSRNDEVHKQNLCKCDARYAAELGKIWDDSTYNYQLWNAKKNSLFNFDYANVCVRSGLTDADECCGAYPERYPFDSTTRMCCNGVQTYNDQLNECCDDGSVKTLGSC